MAGFTLLTLLDDISTVLDDVALLTKAAAQKTAGVVGDDLALTTDQLSGLRASRELPVVWAVAKGSLLNKLVLIPLALLLSALAPFLITPLLMIGGAYLCREGAEKVREFFSRRSKKESPERLEREARAPESDAGPGTAMTEEEISLWEKKKIKGAVRTDFVLSAEIITIALGTIPSDIGFPAKAGALVLIGLVMTAGVYGFVGIVVKLDDLGYLLLGREGRGAISSFFGKVLVGAAPRLMRFLTVLGTAAMFLVGGSIIFHSVPVVGEAVGGLGRLSAPVWAVSGLALGLLLLPIVGFFERLARRLRGKKDDKAPLPDVPGTLETPETPAEAGNRETRHPEDDAP
ncbi:MAG: DUF808 domain-containing protein [Deltaproteobacteria bacterium]|jgi:predicted DNA repair protein MutK|nr:DUF808 domain-containing protein [Deltaproteobacteria bacterium]